MLMLLSGVVAFGWTFGVRLDVWRGTGRSRGWAMRELLTGLGRRSALVYGLALFLASTVVYGATELMLSAGYY